MADTSIWLHVKTQGAKQAQKSFKELGGAVLKMTAGFASAVLAAKGLLAVMERGGRIQGVSNAFAKLTDRLSDLRK